jgi:Asp/Glu/hydantoin racemase
LNGAHDEEIMAKRIALIHAVAVAMQPIEDAFKRLWPEAERVNILDDSLSRDREKSAELTPAISERIGDLADYAAGLGADGILFTCSAFGEAIEAAARRVSRPVLKPNEAMFEAVLAQGRRIGMLATFEPSVASMEQEFRDFAQSRGVAAEIRTVCVPAAMAALKGGDAETHNRLLAERVAELDGSDAILLAHFSTSRAEEVVKTSVSVPVLTGPASAVLKLKAALAI